MVLTASFSPFLETEPLSHTENSVSNDDSTKEPAPSNRPLHTASDYRAAKKERPYYPGQTHTPPPLRRVSSNTTELGPMCAHRRVEGRLNYTLTIIRAKCLLELKLMQNIHRMSRCLQLLNSRVCILRAVFRTTGLASHLQATVNYKLKRIKRAPHMSVIIHPHANAH